jgi:hypothetical protein
MLRVDMAFVFWGSILKACAAGTTDGIMGKTGEIPARAQKVKQ